MNKCSKILRVVNDDVSETLWRIQYLATNHVLSKYLGYLFKEKNHSAETMIDEIELGEICMWTIIGITRELK
jgi:hypothetical protein